MHRALVSVAAALLLALPGTAWADGKVEAGKTKAAGCAGCHGANGEGVAPNPPLAGMKKDRFVQAMADYKSGKRQNAMMKTLAAPLGKEEIEDLAAYYASLKAK